MEDLRASLKERTKKASTKEDLGKRVERMLNRYKSSEFNLSKEVDPPQCEPLLLKCVLFYITFFKKKPKATT